MLLPKPVPLCSPFPSDTKSNCRKPADMQGNAGKRRESDFGHRPSCPRGASPLPYLRGNTASTTASPDHNSTAENGLCQTSFKMPPSLPRLKCPLSVMFSLALPCFCFHRSIMTFSAHCKVDK